MRCQASGPYPAGIDATGFPNFGLNGVGPVGLAFDSNAVGANLYVMDYANGVLYRFPSTGGAASPGTQVGGPLPGAPAGIAFSLDFAHLYVARQSAGDILEISASTGAVIRTVASGIGCATGIVTDPLSGDLFVSQPGCASQILRVVPSTGATSVYTAATGADGLSFDPRDGTLYAAAGGSTVAVIDRFGSTSFINGGPGANTLDGIAVAASRVPGQPPFIFVNQNNGFISKIDLTTPIPTTTTVASGGSRGDFVTVGPDGCLYATQTDRVLEVTNADGSCSLAPPDPAITATGTTITGVEGAAFSGPVATFTDPDVLATADEYAATIHWGDGSSSTGAIVATGPAGQFSVSGGHTYAEEGGHTATIDVVDVDTPNNAATATSPVSVADAALSSSGTTVAAVEGSSFMAVVATLTDADPAGTASDYAASIDWGDGTSSAGSVAGGGPFVASGSHTYAEEGLYAVTVQITDVGGSTTTASGSAHVADAALAASGTSLTTTNPVNGVMAHFTDADPAGTVSDYSATINWGDATSSAGTVNAAGTGFDVSGSHTYGALGFYTVHVHICDIGGSCADATTQVLVFAFPAGGGDFVVGDRSASGHVTYWGAQWAKVNSLSGGAATSSFKGFANSVTPPAPRCGGTWATGPGNSSGPPGSVPTYMGVIVSGSASKSGPNISGNEVHIVVVRTDPGYDADPGHEGTGTVVGVVC